MAASYLFAQILNKINKNIASHLKKHLLKNNKLPSVKKEDFENWQSARCGC
jgi:DNA-binding transcriptional regulator YhcF (GntR family)